MKRIYAVYEDMEDTASIAHRLIDGGYDPDNISIITNNEDGRFDRFTSDTFTDTDVEALEGAGFGALIGMLTAIGTAVVPGIGTLLLAGPLGTTLVAAIGAATGAITGATVASIVDLDLSEATASEYAHILREGGAIMIVNVYETWDEERIRKMMREYQPENVEEVEEE